MTAIVIPECLNKPRDDSYDCEAQNDRTKESIIEENELISVLQREKIWVLDPQHNCDEKIDYGDEEGGYGDQIKGAAVSISYICKSQVESATAAKVPRRLRQSNEVHVKNCF